MRFEDAARDGRAVVYAGVQADHAGGPGRGSPATADAPRCAFSPSRDEWRSTDVRSCRPRIAMFPTLFGDAVPPETRAAADAVLDAALEVAERGEAVRSQVRGAMVEELTARLLARRVPVAAIRRERRILFDGVRSPLRRHGGTRWRRGGVRLRVGERGHRRRRAVPAGRCTDQRGRGRRRAARGLVVFDARRSCDVRLARSTAPTAGTRAVARGLDELAAGG